MENESTQRFAATAFVCPSCNKGKLEFNGDMVFSPYRTQYGYKCNRCGWKVTYSGESILTTSNSNRGQGKLNVNDMNTQQSKPVESGNFGLADSNRVQLPSSLQPGQVGRLQFPGIRDYIPVRINKVHFSTSTVTYDLALWFYNGEETRIYNVDSRYVTPA